MKIYAKQVQPEYQESPFYLFGPDEIYTDVIFTGNRQYKGRTIPEYDEIRAGLDELTNCIDTDGHFIYGIWYENMTEAVKSLIPAPQHKARYSTRDIKAWREIAAEWYITTNETALLCRALQLVTGKEYEYTTIRGCSQDEWQEILFPVEEYDRDALAILEADYFNTGTEWIIHDESNDPEGPEEISGYSVYCYGWNVDQIRQEIADAAGAAPEAVTMYEFAGYYKTSKYNKVGA